MYDEDKGVLKVVITGNASEGERYAKNEMKYIRD